MAFRWVSLCAEHDLLTRASSLRPTESDYSLSRFEPRLSPRRRSDGFDYSLSNYLLIFVRGCVGG